MLNKITISRTIKFVLLIVSLTLLTNCGAPPTPGEMYQQNSAEYIYQMAERYLARHEYTTAIKAFEALDSLYPFGPQTEQAQLDLIYAYYANDDYASASAAGERYIHLYPHSAHTDYAYYIKGLAELEQDRIWFLRYLPLDLSEREASNTRQAYKTFDELVRLFPQSKYAADAHQRMIFLRNLYAQSELHVAQFYMRKEAYVAAANRASYIVQHFQSTPSVVDALVILVKANRAMGHERQAQDALRVLKMNYPNSKI